MESTHTHTHTQTPVIQHVVDSNTYARTHATQLESTDYSSIFAIYMHILVLCKSARGHTEMPQCMTMSYKVEMSGKTRFGESASEKCGTYSKIPK